MVSASNVFYPGHDRPFRVEGDEINYLEGTGAIQVMGSTDGGGSSSLTFTVSAKRTRGSKLAELMSHHVFGDKNL